MRDGITTPSRQAASSLPAAAQCGESPGEGAIEMQRRDWHRRRRRTNYLMVYMRSAHGLFIVLTVCAMTLWRQAGGIEIVTAAVVVGVVLLVCMTMLAWIEIGTGYALRHLMLANLLAPLLLVGPILVPMLVRSDIAKWRRAGAAGSATGFTAGEK